MHNLSTEQKILTVKGASTEDVDVAVSAARQAFEGPWSELPAVERVNLLLKLAEVVHENRELIASIEAFDNGKVQCSRHLLSQLRILTPESIDL
jgi:aldehyde dehydrogenase (NAD(P)+)